jgi:DNA-binding helix-hairpin-helix protein with protein kinase domain
MVKANSCVGKIYLTPSGTIQKITVDLIALPPQTDLTNYT